jgi:hypothetical protein
MELVRQMISDSVVLKFRRLGSSLVRLSSGVLLPSQVTNAYAVGTSVNDVSTLSSLDGVVRTIDATNDALPPEMVKTCYGFCPLRLLHRGQLLQVCRTPIGQEGLRVGKLDGPECQIGPSNFPKDNNSS